MKNNKLTETKIGTAKVIITGKGVYEGTITKEFNVKFSKVQEIKVYDKIETFSTEGLFAEVPLSEAEFKAKYKQGAAVVVEQLKNKMSIHDNIGHHEMWNSWIQTDAYEFAVACKEHKIRIIGWFELGDDAREFVSGMILDIGIVAEYEDEDGRFWCHARKDWIDGIMKEWEEDQND